MSQTYTTKQGEMADMICYRHYGRTAEVTEMVLDANPGLAELGPVLPFATVVTLPDISTRKQAPTYVGLWD